MSPDRPLAIRRTRRAEIDLTEIWLYIAEGNEAAANRVLDEIERVCRELKAGIRSFGVMSWTIFYLIHDDFVEILRVLHSARDLDAVEF